MIKSYKYFSKINEKSSLSQMGVPKSVMQYIQKHYALNPQAQWEEYEKLNEIKKDLMKNEKKLFLQIGDNNIKVYASIYEKNKKFFIVDKFFKSTGDWGDHWEHVGREGTTLTNLIKEEIYIEDKQYKLKSGDFSVVKKDVRDVEREEKRFDEFNKKFREDLLDYITNILKNSYSKKANKIEKRIIDNLADVKEGLDPEEIKDILYQNADYAKKSKRLKSKADLIPKYNLENDEIQHNSLTIFDEYLLRFEDAYSEKLGEFHNVKSLVGQYSREKIFTAFIYYLYTGLLMNLNSYKDVSVLDDLEDFEKELDNDF